MKTNWFKRTLCSILAFVMVLGYVPATAFASEADGLCEHHTQHTTECGYSAAVAGHDCGHAHTEECYQSVTECVHTHGDCGYVPAVEGQSCDCQPDENGEIVHTEGCGYVEAVAEIPCDHVCSEETGCVTKALNCQHQHDAACGYAKETAETPCGFECADCAEGASDEPAPTEYYGSTATEADTTWGLRGASTFSLEGNSSDSLSSGFYRITTKLDRDYKLTLSSSSYSCVTTGESDAQVFYVSQLENGYFVIYDSSKTSVVTARSSEFAENTQMELQEYSEIPQQHWFILPADGEDGSYYIVTAENDMFLDVDNATCEENAIVQLFPRNVLYDAQNWFFEPCENYGDSDNCSCSEQYAGNYVVSNTSEVAIRDGHSVEGNILGKIPLGTELVITKASGAAGNSDAWGHVTYNGVSGCIPMCYVKQQSESLGSGDCGAPGSNVTWNLTSDGTLTISGSGAMRDFNYVYSKVESPWYGKCSQIKSVIIEQGVTFISYAAFYNCSNLTSVTIPSSVTSISDLAFERCSSLTSVTIPNSVTSIGSFIFNGCSRLENINVDPDNKYWCSVDGVLFSKGMNTLVAYPVGRIGAYECPEGVTSIGDRAFSDCSSLTSVTIPSSVTSIGGRAFSGCSSLTSMMIPNSVTSIGQGAFRHCSSLTSVTIPSSVTSIGSEAFSGCSSLTSVTIPSSVTSIGSEAFSGCSSLTSVTIPNSVTSIETNAFYGCSSLTSVTIPNSVTSIGSGAFYECRSLTSVTIPNSVSSISYSTFSCCSSLTSVTIPNSVTSIGEYAFSGCSSLTSVTIPNSVTSIGDSAFSGCSNLASVTIPSSVTSIGDSAFSGCSNLASVTIPSSVTSIGENAFSHCSSLTDINVDPNNKYWCSVDGVFFSKDMKTLVTYPSGRTGAYECPEGITSINDFAFYGSNSLTSVTIPSSVISIGEYAFRHCSSLTSVTIPSSITSIDDWAFSGCSSLTSVTIPNSVTSIGEYTFCDCSSLTSVTIPNSVTSIGDSAFFRCSSLISVTIPNSTTSISYQTFSGCDSLTSVTIPKSITSIRDCAFGFCTKLKDVYYSGTEEQWKQISIGRNYNSSLINATIHYNSNGASGTTGNSGTCGAQGDNLTWTLADDGTLTISGSGAMKDYASNSETPWYNKQGQIKSVTIEQGVTSIGDCAFSDCDSLTSVTIPNSVTSIGANAFYGCSSLKDVYYGGTEERWTTIEIGEENEPLTDATIHYGAMDSDTIVSTGFQFGVDTFSFDNDFLAFGNSHYISDNDYKELLKTMPLFWELVFRYDDMYDRTFSKNQFNGVCFGISALMALVYYDYISLDPYVSMCVEPYQLPLPKDYPDLNSLFNYVYGLQFRFKPLLFGDPQWLCGKTVVQDLLNKKLVIINFQTHSILGYAIDAQSDDECYIVYCADPNELTGDPLRLKISKRTYELVDTKSKFSFIFDNFELMATLLPQSANRINNETQYSKVSLFATNSSSFVISGDGKTSTVCGDDISGDFPIEAMHFVYGDEVHSNVYSISISSGYNVLFTDEAKHYAAAYFPESNVVTHIESDADEITVMPAGELRFSGALGSTTVRTNAAFDENNTLISISGAFAELQMIPSHDKLTMLSDTGIDGLSITITSDTKQDTLEADVNGHSATLVQKKADGLEPYYSLLRDDNTTIIDTPHDYVLFNVSTLGLDNSATIYIDGIEYQLESDDSIIINDANAHTMVTYSYNNPKATDVHTQYPTGMKVWKLKQENGVYTAEYVPEFDNLLQYSGSSIRITGNKGIRMITSVNQDTRNALTGNGLAGFKLLEYGTLLAQTSKLGDNPLVLGGGEYVKSNYAYKKGVADPVFKYTNGLIQYTNVLVGFTDEQCKEDIAMRPYMKLQDKNGEEFVIYGGIVYRSIGYIAYQNRNAFQPGSAAYEYVWSIIHNVYGNQYDSEYKK